MDNILERVKQMVDNEGITITSLEKNIGASKGVISRALSKGTDIQSKWIQIIVENYPQYNVEWLITGKGMMKKNSTPQVSDEEIRTLEKQIISLQKEIIHLQKENARLKATKSNKHANPRTVPGKLTS